MSWEHNQADDPHGMHWSPPRRIPLSRPEIRNLSDQVLALKLRTLAGEPRIFNDMERRALIMEAVRRLEET